MSSKLDLSLTSLISPCNSLSPPNTILQFNTQRNDSLLLPQFSDQFNSYNDDYTSTQSYHIHSPNNAYDPYKHTLYDDKLPATHDIIPGSIGLSTTPNNTTDKYMQEEKQSDYTQPLVSHIHTSSQYPTRNISSIDDMSSTGTRSELSYDSVIDQQPLSASIEDELVIDFDLELNSSYNNTTQAQSYHHNNAHYNPASKTAPNSPRRPTTVPVKNDWHVSSHPLPAVSLQSSQPQSQYSRTPTQLQSTSHLNNNQSYHSGNMSMTMPANAHTPHRSNNQQSNQHVKANLFHNDQQSNPVSSSYHIPSIQSHPNPPTHPLQNMHPNGMFSAPVSPRSQYTHNKNNNNNYAYPVDQSAIPLPTPIDEADDNIIVGRYTKAERRRKIIRFQEKKQRRTWHKKILYACRKTFADQRPRVGGRFVKMVTLANGERVPYDSPQALAMNNPNNNTGAIIDNIIVVQ